ncbi:exonuclease domain-containing protein [uncultured Croceitalea sp.]|uniref:exonuclease domain-containing protein n=1 Tax=uncultured Croceitalea sp. TaxID=1798908 RepID=UPI0033066037
MYTIIDIETTGNGIKGNRITEIAIFKYDGDQIIDEFTSLVNPECPIPYFITGLTGIDDQMVANAPIFNEIAHKILEITKDCIFVAHAVNFDYGVIKEEFRLLEIDFTRKKLCTVRLSRKLIPGFKSYSLGKLCSSIGIPLKDRHRARGDAHATVLLFKKLLQTENSKGTITSFLNARSQEATLPPLVSRENIDELPTKPGIYYFRNSTGKIIYVGKAINIKKRVLGHFYTKSNHELLLCNEISKVDYELSGSELIALLMESAAIKAHFPKFNRAQKRNVTQYAIFSYEDRSGILHLAYNTLKNSFNPILILNNKTDCRAYLEEMCKAFSLCPKYCHLQSTNGPCSHYEILKCDGVCCNKETIEAYNLKVKNAITSVKKSAENVILERKGRNLNEKAFVLIKDGTYMGYGFVENDTEISSFESLEAFLIPQKHTIETESIIKSALKREIDKLPISL